MVSSERIYMTDEERHIKFSEAGRKGGRISGSRKQREHFIMMGKKSAEARNKKKLEAMRTEVNVDNKN
jgi:hypothetical protein